MDVRCEKCGTEYEFDENRIGPNGVTVKCTNCGHVFKVRRPAAARSTIPRASTTIGSGPQGKEWLVRKPDSQMIAFRELTTLQKWIVEGRIQRDDEISKNGETWKRLGNIMELEPFFSVYEKAQTLNSLIEQQPVQLRGSELLAAVNPVEGAASGPAYPIPSRSQIVQADPLPSALPSQVPQPLAPKAAPTSSDQVPVPALPGAPVPPMPSSARGFDGPAAERTSAPSTHFAGPAALERTVEPAAPPASFQSGTLDFPVSDDDGDDPVVSFERGQRNRRMLVGGLIIVCLGLGASAAVAMYGPEDNPLRGLAVRYGLITPRPADDGADALVEQARQQADLDTVASQTRAIDLLGQALAQRPSDLGLLADRATHVALLARAYLRWANDLDDEAQRAQAALDAWKSAEPSARGDRPDVVDPEATRAKAQRHRVRAENLLAQAEPWLEQVEAQAADDPRTLRARAALAAAKHGPDEATRLTSAKAAADKAGRTDPILLSLEAAAALEQGEDGFAQARAQLSKASTARPSFMRAQALAARLALLEGELDEAGRILARIEKVAPEHEEAARLAARLAAAKAVKAEAEAADKPEPEKAPEPEPEKEAKPAKRGFEYWMSRGDRLRRLDRTMPALNAYGRAAELKPDSAEVHVGKGWCLLDLDRPHPALAAFERALKVNDRYAEAYYGKGEALRRLKRNDEAVTAYRAYLDRAPGGPEQRVVERRLEELGGG